MAPLELLTKNNYTLQEYNLLEQAGLEYWHTNILDANKVSFSAGFGNNKEISRKIAYSEFLERTKFRELKNSDEFTKTLWGLDKINTACGFAAGFDETNTITRSIGEALERWVLSKWIDENFAMTQALPSQLTAKLDAASKWFSSQFDEMLFFQKDILIFVNINPMIFSICATVGFKNGGAYLGSSVKSGSNPNWQHALLESFRHVLLVKNSQETGRFPDNKVRYFS